MTILLGIQASDFKDPVLPKMPDDTTSELHMAEELRYAAFISYRHVEPDQTWARWLHTSLETYCVPVTFRTDAAVSRLGKVFRDTEELAAAADLRVEIQKALRSSSMLIVICSSKTPHSPWVDQEIRYFQSLGRNTRVVALLVEGEPADSFPRALCEVDPDVLESTETTIREPLAADVRPMVGVHHSQRQRQALLRIIAQLLRCEYDDLFQRDAERRRRQYYQFSLAALGIGFVVFLSLAFGFYQQKLRNLEQTIAELKREERLVRSLQAKDRVIAQLPNLRQRALWPQAQSLLTETKNLLEPDTAREVFLELSEAEADIQLLERLDEIRMRKADFAAKFPERIWKLPSLRTDYAMAFQSRGYDFRRLPNPDGIEALSRRLNSSPIHAELLGALDDWAWDSQNSTAEVIWELTANVTSQAWRRDLKFATVSATECMRISREVPIQQISPAIVIGMGLSMRLLLYDQRRESVRWLEAGAKQYPTDFWVHFYLGVEYLRLNEPMAAAGAFRAAVALRPDAKTPREHLEKSLRLSAQSQKVPQ